MNCIYIAVLSLLLISILGDFSEGTNETETTTNSNDIPKKWNCLKTNPSLDTCPSDSDCEKLGTECLQCECNPSCEYGETVNATCKVHKDIS